MKELPPKIPPFELLKIGLLRGKEHLTEEQRAHVVANNLPHLFSLLSASSPDCPDIGLRDLCVRRLQEISSGYGLDSVDDLRTAAFELCTQLKEILSEKDWNGYFGDHQEIREAIEKEKKRRGF